MVRTSLASLELEHLWQEKIDSDMAMERAVAKAHQGAAGLMGTRADLALACSRGQAREQSDWPAPAGQEGGVALPDCSSLSNGR